MKNVLLFWNEKLFSILKELLLLSETNTNHNKQHYAQFGAKKGKREIACQQMISFPRNIPVIDTVYYGIAIKLNTSAKMAQVSMIPRTIR